MNRWLQPGTGEQSWKYARIHFILWSQVPVGRSSFQRGHLTWLWNFTGTKRSCAVWPLQYSMLRTGSHIRFTPLWHTLMNFTQSPWLIQIQWENRLHRTAPDVFKHCIPTQHRSYRSPFHQSSCSRRPFVPELHCQQKNQTYCDKTCATDLMPATSAVSCPPSPAANPVPGALTRHLWDVLAFKKRSHVVGDSAGGVSMPNLSQTLHACRSQLLPPASAPSHPLTPKELPSPVLSFSHSSLRSPGALTSTLNGLVLHLKSTSALSANLAGAAEFPVHHQKVSGFPWNQKKPFWF